MLTSKCNVLAILCRNSTSRRHKLSILLTNTGTHDIRFLVTFVMSVQATACVGGGTEKFGFYKTWIKVAQINISRIL